MCAEDRMPGCIGGIGQTAMTPGYLLTKHQMLMTLTSQLEVQLATLRAHNNLLQASVQFPLASISPA